MEHTNLSSTKLFSNPITELSLELLMLITGAAAGSTTGDLVTMGVGMLASLLFVTV